MSAVLEVQGLIKTYVRGTVPVGALRGVDLAIDEGRFLAIMGPSGSGKSTLLHILGALDTPTGGIVRFKGQTIANWGEEPEASLFRRQHIGFVFQSLNLVQHLTAEENVILPLLLLGASSKEMKERAEAWLRRVGLLDRRYHFPHQLSGGEQQRIAIARALVHNPSIILADEPTGSLDTRNTLQVLNLVSEIHREEARTIVVVTHDPMVAAHAQEVVFLRDGRVAGTLTLPPSADLRERTEAVSATFRDLVGEAVVR